MKNAKFFVAIVLLAVLSVGSIVAAYTASQTQNIETYNYYEAEQSTQSLGSITTGQEYTATTTPYGGQWTDQLLKEGWGSLGSVIITKAGDVEFTLYDATSTGAVLNDSRFNKSQQQLARIPANLSAGTYIFDVTFNDGLVMDVESGTNGTSTITFR